MGPRLTQSVDIAKNYVAPTIRSPPERHRAGWGRFRGLPDLRQPACGLWRGMPGDGARQIRALARHRGLAPERGRLDGLDRPVCSPCPNPEIFGHGVKGRASLSDARDVTLLVTPERPRHRRPDR